jgi:hypothetical protein
MSRRLSVLVLVLLAFGMVSGLGWTAGAGPDEEFAESAHAVLSEAVKSAAARGACLSCHDGKGLIPGERAPGQDITDPVAMSCETCHDWGNDQPAGLRRYGEALLNGGAFAMDSGKAAICITCHNTRRTADDGAVAAMAYPHYGAQGEMFAGVGGFEFPGPAYTNSAHTTIEDGCVACHMAAPLAGSEVLLGGHTFKMSQGAVQNINACIDCHPKVQSVNRLAYGDYDGDGRLEGIQSEVQGLMALLEQAINSQIDGGQGTFGHSHGRVVFTDRNGKAITVPDQETLVKAVWNLTFVEADGSAGVHNAPYAVQLLQASYRAVTGHDVPGAKLR